MCEVLDKGKKRRSLHFVRETGTTLRNYPINRYGSMEKVRLEEPLFINTHRSKGSYALTRSGALQLIRRLGKEGALTRGNVAQVECKPFSRR